MLDKNEVMLRVGRESQRGCVRLSTYDPQLLTISVSYKGERAATVVLTPAQVQQLRQALDALQPPVEQPAVEQERLKLVA